MVRGKGMSQSLKYIPNLKCTGVISLQKYPDFWYIQIKEQERKLGWSSKSDYINHIF